MVGTTTMPFPGYKKVHRCVSGARDDRRGGVYIHISLYLDITETLLLGEHRTIRKRMFSPGMNLNQPYRTGYVWLRLKRFPSLH